MEIRVRVDDDLALALPALEARLGRPVAEWLAEIVGGNLEDEIRAVMARDIEAELKAKARQIKWAEVAKSILPRVEAEYGQGEN